MRRAALLLAWWFMWLGFGYSGSAASVGPFQGEAGCNQMRAWVESQITTHRETGRRVVSWCWWDGRQP